MAYFVTPVTILTGFLGAGKTTLVNRLLKETHGKRFALIENEFGDVSIDDDLVYREAVETIIQLADGCLCCRVRGDLARALGDLARRKEAGELEFDHVLIEASGLADPGPIIQTFLAETMLLTRYALDAVVALVDAANVGKALVAAKESLAQIALADWILVTKADRLDERDLDEAVRRVREINPSATLRAVDLTTSLPEEVFDGLLCVRGYELDRVRIGDPEPASRSAFFAEEASHTHDVSAISFRTDRLLDVRRTQATFAMLRARFGDRIWRVKGILSLATYPKRVVIQGVQELLQVTDGVVWRPYERRESKIVVIGAGLDRDAVLHAFESCVVDAEHAGAG